MSEKPLVDVWLCEELAKDRFKERLDVYTDPVWGLERMALRWFALMQVSVYADHLDVGLSERTNVLLEELDYVAEMAGETFFGAYQSAKGKIHTFAYYG